MNIKRLRKTDWYTHRGNGQIKDTDIVAITPYPHGARCEIAMWENSILLRNGDHTTINSEIGRLLYEAGIEGEFLINSPKSLPQVMSRYLTWWLSTAAKSSVVDYSSIKVVVFDKLPTKDLPFEVVVVNSQKVPVSSVLDILATHAKSPTLSMLKVQTENGDTYELEPTRIINTRILDVTEHGLVVVATRQEAGTVNTPFLVSRVSRNARAMLELHGLDVSSLIGEIADIQYTMYSGGKSRLAVYKSATLFAVRSLRCVDISALQKRAEANGAGYTYPDSTKRTHNKIISGSSCVRSDLRLEDGDYNAYDNDVPLFSLKRGCVRGQYCVLINKAGVFEMYHIESPYDISLISPASFLRQIDTKVYTLTGDTVEAVGLLHRDESGRLTIGTTGLGIDNLVKE